MITAKELKQIAEAQHRILLERDSDKHLEELEAKFKAQAACGQFYTVVESMNEVTLSRLKELGYRIQDRHDDYVIFWDK